jgi:predicted amidohydrolase YtcJ
VLDKVPKPTPREAQAALLTAIREANRLGLTRVDSAGDDFDLLAVFAKIEREGKLTLRISIADWINPPGLSAAHLAALETARSRYHDQYLSCCVAKFIMDGVIESHTAYLPAGYADRPAETGMRFFMPEDYRAAVRALSAHDFQIYTHAIGDGAIKLALDAYEEAQSAAPTRANPRNRIEHAEAPDPEDIPRFGKLGVIASMQPLHSYPDVDTLNIWTPNIGPERASRAWVWKSIADAGGRYAFGSDWPVVTLNPWYGLQTAVTRQTREGKPEAGFDPEQRLTVAQAIEGYTLGAAFAGRREKTEGSLEKGKLADLIIVSQNVFEIDPHKISETKVRTTIVGGQVVYKSDAK